MKMAESSVFSIIKKYWNIAPVDVRQIILDAGVDYREVVMPRNQSGMIERKADDQYVISVNVSDSPVRRRFTAAHELAHYVYHRDLMGRSHSDGRLYRVVPADGLSNDRIGAPEETEANRFAANLLMPQHLIEFLEGKGITDIEELASRLDVSVPAMRVRKGLSPYPSAEEVFGAVQSG